MLLRARESALQARKLAIVSGPPRHDIILQRLALSLEARAMSVRGLPISTGVEFGPALLDHVAVAAECVTTVDERRLADARPVLAFFFRQGRIERLIGNPPANPKRRTESQAPARVRLPLKFIL